METPDPLSSFLASKHEELLNDYRTPDGEYVQFCTQIAAKVAGILKAQGKSPYLLQITGEPEPDGLGTRYLVPKQYDGRVKWGSHFICCESGIVYDPMVGEPMPLDTYTSTVFSENVVAKPYVSSEDIAQTIEDWADTD